MNAKDTLQEQKSAMLKRIRNSLSGHVRTDEITVEALAGWLGEFFPRTSEIITMNELIGLAQSVGIKVLRSTGYKPLPNVNK